MKKILGLSTLALAGVLAFTGCSCGKDDNTTNLPALPAARLTEDGCTSNNYDVTCSAVDSKNLYNYLDRSDVEYIDLRDFNAYEAEHLEGFRMVQFFTNIYDKTGSDTATQLFRKDYTPRYKDSVEILKGLIPQDKTVFLMCQSGGRVVDMMKILELNGWDMSKVYNVGGMNQYNKENVAEHYGDLIVARSTSAITFKKGTHTEEWSGHTYTTNAFVSVDTNNKITAVYVTGTEYTAGVTAEWNQDTWVKAKYEYCQSLVGKTLADIQTMLGSEGADGADVVTGSTLSSNRVLRAVVNALTPAA